MMSNFSYKNHYRRNLPHFQFHNMIYFITFRLAFNLPEGAFDTLLKEKENFDSIYKSLNESEKKGFQMEFYHKRFLYIDNIIDNLKTNKNYLEIPEIASCVYDALLFFDKKKYEIIVFCIMPNHVHLVVKILQKNEIDYYSLADVMHSIKRYTANECNKIIDKNGQFWLHENYDHIVRNEIDLNNCFNYTIMNPVKAKLVENWEDWKYTYFPKD